MSDFLCWLSQSYKVQTSVSGATAGPPLCRLNSQVGSTKGQLLLFKGCGLRSKYRALKYEEKKTQITYVYDVSSPGLVWSLNFISQINPPPAYVRCLSQHKLITSVLQISLVR